MLPILIQLSKTTIHNLWLKNLTQGTGCNETKWTYITVIQDLLSRTSWFSSGVSCFNNILWRINLPDFSTNILIILKKYILIYGQLSLRRAPLGSCIKCLSKSYVHAIESQKKKVKSKKKNKQPTLGVHFTEVSVFLRCPLRESRLQFSLSHYSHWLHEWGHVFYKHRLHDSMKMARQQK